MPDPKPFRLGHWRGFDKWRLPDRSLEAATSDRSIVLGPAKTERELNRLIEEFYRAPARKE